MKPINALRVLCPALILIASPQRSAFASPTMIRLGYHDCATCHTSPQGGGLLTTYGKGIDRAQSLRADESTPADTSQRRFLYDVRLFASSAVADPLRTAVPSSHTTGFRLMMRSSVRINDRQRMSYSVGVETPALATSRAPNANSDATVAVPKALWEYQATTALTLAIGRDEMPSGIGLPDPLTFMRKANDAGNTAYPTQVKVFLSGRRLQVTPYAFGPGGTSAVRRGGGGRDRRVASARRHRAEWAGLKRA
jgi:hypothetical protein